MVSSEREVSNWKPRRGGPANDGLTEEMSDELLTSGLYPNDS
jgi:hypothetical protein